MKQVSLKVYVTFYPYYIYGIDEETKTSYVLLNNTTWIKTSEYVIIPSNDEMKLIDENVFYVQS